MNPKVNSTGENAKRLSRREFMKVVGGAAAGLAATQLLAACRPAEVAPAPAAPPTEEAPAVAKPVTLKWVHHIGENETFWNKMIQVFEERNPDIKVELKIVDDAVIDTYFAPLYAAECAECPDIWSWGFRPKLLELAKAGYIQPTPVEMMPNYQKNIVAQNVNVKGLMVDGVLYNIPGFAYYGGIFYDRNVWESLGLGDEPKTYEEFWDLLETIKGIGKMPAFAVDGAHVYADLWDCVGTVAHLDPNWVADLAAGKHKFTDEEFVASWRDARAIIEKGYAPPDNWAIPFESLESQVALGQIALTPQGSWVFAGYKAMNPDIQLEAFPMPPVGGGEPTYVLWGRDEGFGWLNANTPVEPAAKFLDFMLSDEWWIASIKEVGVPPMWPIQTEADYTGTEGESLMRMLAKAKRTMVPLAAGDDLHLAGVVPPGTDWYDLYTSIFSKFVTGEVSAEEGAAELQEAVEAWGTIPY